jgi:general L-amino acid transport system permease protein
MMPAGSVARGPFQALRRAPMFRDRTNTIATVALGACLAFVAWRFVEWAVVRAVWTLPAGSGSSPCRAAKGQGACWAVVGERVRFVLLGAYPVREQWRPELVCVMFVALYGASAVRGWWKPWLLAVWIAVPCLATALLGGRAFHLAAVPNDAWGGLPLTLILSTVGFAAATPLAVALALARRSQMPAIRGLSIAYVELVRGVPVITFLFMAAVMFPLFVPPGFVIDKLLRAQIAFVMVIAAYLAEVVRAGLLAVPAGQYEAAASMGLRFWPATRLIVLPQALRASIPAIVNTFISFFKDTSLVAVIGLFDLLGTAKAVIVDPKWVGFGVEVYLFVAAIYFAFCFAVSRCSQHLEQVLIARSRR